MPDLIPAVEIIYRDLARPKTPDTKPVCPIEAAKTELTRDDVNAIIQRKRTASLQDLQHIIDHGKEFKLTSRERNQLSVDLTIAVAHARQGNGRHQGASDRFIAQTLGLLQTPFGLIERDWVQRELQSGAQAISRCRNHRPPRCNCWSSERAILWHVQSTHGEKSPEGWAARRIYELLEELEVASRPDGERGCNVPSYSHGN